MKIFVSIVASVAIYLIVGLVVWNIVFANLDINTMTLVELSDWRLGCYAAVTFVAACIIPQLSKYPVDIDFYLFPLIVVGVNIGIALGINHWEDAMDSVVTVFAIIFNVVNIGLLSIEINEIVKE